MRAGLWRLHYTGFMEQYPAWDDDPLRRSLIERAPPLTWRGIFGCAVVTCLGLILALATRGHTLTIVGLGLSFVGIIQVLRGLIRMAWLRLGGTDRPLNTYLERRFRQ